MEIVGVCRETTLASKERSGGSASVLWLFKEDDETGETDEALKRGTIVVVAAMVVVAVVVALSAT